MGLLAGRFCLTCLSANRPWWTGWQVGLQHWCMGLFKVNFMSPRLFAHRRSVTPHRPMPTQSSSASRSSARTWQ
jgi:hypothetical protein